MYSQEDIDKLIRSLVDSCHSVTSMIGVFILLYLWYSYYYLQNRKTIKMQDLDYGLLLLAGGYLSYAIQDVINYDLFKRGKIIESTLSMLSDYLFLASFVYFEFGFKIIERLKKKRNWFILLIILFISGLSISIFFENLTMLVQICTTVFVILFTGLLLVVTFYHRNLSGISGLALLIVFADLISQISIAIGKFLKDHSNIYESWQQVCHYNRLLLPTLYIISNTGLLIIFIMLAFSWFMSSSGMLEKFKVNNNIDIIINNELVPTSGAEVKLSEHSFAKLLNRLLVEFFDVNQVCERLCSYYNKTKKQHLCAEVRQIQTRFNIVAAAIKRGVADKQEYVERNALILALQEHIQRLWDN